MGIRVAAFLALFVACASAGSMMTNTWTDSSTCSGTPDKVGFTANSVDCSVTNCTGAYNVSTTIECDVVYERPTGAAYVHTETYSEPNCKGFVVMAVSYRPDLCQGIPGVYSTYTCQSDGSVAVMTCSDSACSSDCTTETIRKGCSTNIKYECSSGVRNLVVAGITAAVAAVASFWSM